MKTVLAILAVFAVILQYDLWLGKGGIGDAVQLHHAISAQKQENVQLRERNQTLAAEVQDLKQGLAAVEERARSELGMIREGETFYQIIESGQ